MKEHREEEGAVNAFEFLELLSLLRTAEIIDEHNEYWWKTGNPKWIVERKLRSVQVEGELELFG